MKKRWMLYGAYGTAGRRILENHRERGLPLPIVAGRNEQKVKAIAAQYDADWAAFSLDDEAKLVDQLHGVDLLMLAAGPYSQTSAPAVAACLQTHTHYLDLTGEIEVFKTIHAQDTAARDADLVLMPGVGADVVPTDCLALWLADAMPDAVSLDIALTQTGAAKSAGTLKTALEGVAKGNYITKDGELTPAKLGHTSLAVPFAHETQRCFSIPLADVYSAHWSTGINNVTIFGSVSRAGVIGARMMRPILRTRPGLRFAQKMLDWFTPQSKPDANTTMQFWGRVTNQAGDAVEATLTTIGGAYLTPEAACECVKGVLAGELRGAMTPGMAFGHGFIKQWGEVQAIENKLASATTKAA